MVWAELGVPQPLGALKAKGPRASRKVSVTVLAGEEQATSNSMLSQTADFFQIMTVPTLLAADGKRYELH
jgi:hypothetical protein